MSQITTLLKTLKQELKASGMTYADVASRLGLSESSVKRIFSESRLSLARLEALCQLVDMDLTDLVRKMGSERKRIPMLTKEQEREVVADPKLLLVVICVLNHWTFEDIIETYRVSEHECVRLLARLDRLGFIELQPLNRYRLSVAGDFQWIPDGPIQRFFRREVQPGFMQSTFTGPGEKLVFRNGMLSRASNATLLQRVDRLVAGFSELHAEDAGLPLEDRFGSSLLIAFRPWEFSYFRELRRESERKVF
jgi:transcriptional regulator with XRE-family HTH domain